MDEVNPKKSEPRSKEKQPLTSIGRISAAIREQNWFAALLELVIVVVGIVIAFQITEWGQQRADRAKEYSYLVQLAQDMRQTENHILVSDSVSITDRANSKLLRAFFLPEPPSADSIFIWRQMATRYTPLTPVTATAEAMISSGEISLISNDSLRSRITQYVPFVKQRAASSDNDIFKWWDESVALANRYDLADMMMQTMDDAEIDSTADADLYFFLPAGERERPFPVNVDNLLSDQEAYNNIRGMLEYKRGMATDREMVLSSTRELLTLIETELANRVR